MDKLPESLFEEPKITTLGSTSSNIDGSSGKKAPSSSSSSNTPTSSSSSENGSPNAVTLNSARVVELLELLYEPESREAALHYLIEASGSCKHETCTGKTCMELAPLLWDSFNVVFILLEELITLYKYLSPMKLGLRESNRACNALALIQILAANPGTKMLILKAKIPVYLYPFLQTTGDDKPLRFLRVASLGVIGALAKCDEPIAAGEIVHFLLETEIFPLCLFCMDKGDVLSQEVATFIVIKILMEEEGLRYCFAFAERFLSVVQVLGRLVEQLSKRPIVRLLKYAVRCYARLSETPKMTGLIEALKRNIPAKLKDDTFLGILRENPEITRMLQQMFCNLTIGLGPK